MTLQQEIIQALGVKPTIHAEEEVRRSVDFLKTYLQTYPFLKIPRTGNQRWPGFHPGGQIVPDCHHRVA